MHVMPSWSGTVARVHLDRLFVTSVPTIITPTVTQVNSPDVSYVVIGRPRMAHQHQLLMVGTAAPHAIVEESFPSSDPYLFSESSVFLGTKRESVAMRTPQQASHINTFSTDVTNEGSDGWTLGCQKLVAVTSPVRKSNLVAPLKR
jgi:hypothetical protein